MTDEWRAAAAVAGALSAVSSGPRPAADLELLIALAYVLPSSGMVLDHVDAMRARKQAGGLAGY